jgi:hypothetical protein
VLFRSAYTFEYRHADGREPRTYVAELVKAVERWRRDEARNVGALTYRRGPGFLALDDRRTTVAAARYVLEGVEAAVFAACEDGASFAEVRATAARELGRDPGESEVRRALGALHAERLLFEDRDRWLALALPATERTLA